MPDTLAAWLGREGVTLEAGLSLRRARPGEGGYSVRAERSVARGSTVAQIPKLAALSHRTCSIAPELITALPESTPVALRLAVCVLHELLLGENSRWATYLSHCPTDTVPIAILWAQHSQASQITRRTELDAELKRINITETSLATFFARTALPTCFPPSTHPLYAAPPDLPAFLHAYSLVSSRAFQVDAYHSLALVPLADLFNHSSPNHVHLASDDFVCPECGSLHECEHDRDDGAKQEPPTADRGEGDDTCEMVADAEIEPGEEVFNTYGQLSNASLLAYYGFMLEANELDRVTFTLEEVGLNAPRRELLALWRTDRAQASTAATLDLDGLVSVSSLLDKGASNKTPAEGHRALWIDAEANLSLPLFLALIAAHATATGTASPASPTSPASVAPSDDVAAILRGTAEQWAACMEAAESDSPPPPKRARLAGPASAEARRVARVAAQARKLVAAKVAGQWRPELTGPEVLELAEAATGTERLALEFLANERLVLECVAAKWDQLAAFCGEA